MADDMCSKCGAWIWRSGFHECPPRWRVWCSDDDENIHDVTPIFAADEETAAELWAEAEDVHSADYTIVGGSDETVHVCSEDEYQAVEWNDDGTKGVGSLTVRVFIVSGEAVPSYHAKEVTL